MSFYDEIKDASGAFKFYVAGEWKTSTSGKHVAIGNPTTGETAFKVQGAPPPPVDVDRKKGGALFT